VVSSIAEGQGRLTRGEFRHFPGQARGSLLELSTQLAIARDPASFDRKTHVLLEKEGYQLPGFLNRLLLSLRNSRPGPFETSKA
jgi:four helix bundle protein